MLTTAIYKDKINGKNLLSEFGLVIQTGTEELLSFPTRKTTLTNDWREENGKEYDLTLPRFEDKEVTLQCAIVADNDTQFWAQYNAFFEEITQSGWQTLYIDDHSQNYSFFYQKTGNWKKSTKRLKNVEKVFVKFSLTIVVK